MPHLRRSDCGDREDIVSYGNSSRDDASVAYDWPQYGPISQNGLTPSKSNSEAEHGKLARNTVCNDAGGATFMSALFGS